MTLTREAYSTILVLCLACSPFSFAQQTSRPTTVAWKTLEDGIADHHSSRRQAALAAIATLGPVQKGVNLVYQVLRDRDEGVRVAAATALGEMGSHRAIPALKQSLEDDSAPVRFAAAQALWKLGDHSGRTLIEQVLSKDGNTSDGMLKQGLNDANKKLHSPGELAHIGLIEASGAFLGPFSYGIVVAEQLAKDKNAPARALSASLLASDHNAKSVRALEDAIQDDNSGVRAAAAKAIGNHPCKQLIPDLQFLLDDKEEVKYMAAASIVRIQARLGPHAAPECELLNRDLAQQTTAEVH